MPRTAGFNSLDIAGMHDFTLLINDVLMFIGGGSAGTAGGIKVTTFAAARLRHPRRDPRRTQRARSWPANYPPVSSARR